MTTKNDFEVSLIFEFDSLASVELQLSVVSEVHNVERAEEPLVNVTADSGAFDLCSLE